MDSQNKLETGDTYSIELPSDPPVRSMRMVRRSHCWVFEKPRCPYCGGRLTVSCNGWHQEPDGWVADDLQLDCENDDEKHEDHCYMPYENSAQRRVDMQRRWLILRGWWMPPWWSKRDDGKLQCWHRKGGIILNRPDAIAYEKKLHIDQAHPTAAEREVERRKDFEIMSKTSSGKAKRQLRVQRVVGPRRSIYLTEAECNYLWHLADNHKMETTSDEPDYPIWMSALSKLQRLRESKWPNAPHERPGATNPKDTNAK